MSAVGIMSIVLGVLLICARGPLLVAPAAWLQWFAARLQTDGSIRLLGLFVVLLCASMVAAGMTARSALAVILALWGLLGLVLSPWLLVFPGSFRRFAGSFMPAADQRSFPGWRMIGALNVLVGGLLIYFGALEL